MDLREEYKQTIDKINYFQNLSNEDKRKLFYQLNQYEKREILSILPLQYLKNFSTICTKEEQQQIYKNLDDSKLKEIYKNSTKEEQQNMIEILETRQIKLNDILEESRRNIQASTSAINRANQSIEQSHNNIIMNKENIKQKKVELKNQKVVLKQLERERKRNLKKVLSSKKKLSSPLNRIGIISKHRTKKYLDRLNELEKTNQMIDANKMENARIQNEINDLKNNIKQEKENIKEQNKQIEESKTMINSNVSRIERTEVQIKKLSNTEKKVLGRKLYKKTVFERDCIIVRSKSQKQEHSEKNEQTLIQQIPKVEKLNDSDVEVIEPVRNNTEEMVNNIANNANKLQQIGVNFYPPANRISNVQGPELLSRPIMSLTQEQLILITYTMIAVYNYTMQKMIEQQMIEQQNLSNGYTRTLSPNSRGIVNLTLLASIMFFILGLILFFIK